MYLTLVPAYGRDYKSKAEVQRDFDANKDFIIATYTHPYDGKPANASSLRAEGVTQVNIRYAKLRKTSQFMVSSKLSENPTRWVVKRYDLFDRQAWGVFDNYDDDSEPKAVKQTKQEATRHASSYNKAWAKWMEKVHREAHPALYKNPCGSCTGWKAVFGG